MAHIVSEMQMINDMDSRQKMADKIPERLYSSTCIGCGLDLATQVEFKKEFISFRFQFLIVFFLIWSLQMLTENGRKGGIIILVTDGKNSPGYLDICDVQDDIINAGIRVVSIALG